jgi:hypothetical protein
MIAVKGGIPAGAQLQQPVQGGRLQPGQLRQALGGPPSGRGQGDLGPLGAGQGHDGAHGVALAAARPAGEHCHPLSEGQPDRRLLLRGQGDAGALVEPVERGRPVHRLEAGQAIAGRVEQPQQPTGEGPLGTVERHQPDRPPCPVPNARGRGGGEGLGDYTLLGDQLLQAALGEPGLHAEQLGRLGHQLGLGQVAVPVLGGLRQGELQAGLDPLGAVMRDAQDAGRACRRS